MPRTATTQQIDTPTEITEVPISDEARNEQIYRLMAIELLGDALTRLAWYQENFQLPLETAKGVTAATVINFYESAAS